MRGMTTGSYFTFLTLHHFRFPPPHLELLVIYANIEIPIHAQPPVVITITYSYVRSAPSGCRSASGVCLARVHISICRRS
jgi:hypothetical protein